MRYNQFLSLLFILPPLLFSSCDKNTIQPRDNISRLPPITMEGKQTFACLLNGEVWKHTPYAFALNLTSDYSPIWKILNIGAKIKHDGILESAITFSADIDTLGVYDLSHISYYDQSFPDFGLIREEFLIESEPHFVEITHLDLDNFIVSGLFQFTMLDTLFGDTLRFTEGRFDCKWAY